ncbi:MAG TPA: GAP family protein [Ilumatobacteraceae bacterium]|nr:GAP family protein [Ilumatobacteraceae bacterium]
MGTAIGQILGVAVGVAISPIPIIATILMLFSNRAKSNSVAFLVGWIFGLVAVATVILRVGFEGSDGTSDVTGWIKAAIGVVFLLLAVKQWRDRPREGEEPPMPTWMASIDGFTAVKSFGLAALLSGVNPKNLGLTIAAASSIGAAGLTGSEEAVVVAVYVLIASCTLMVPVIGYLVAGDRMRPALDAMKAWLLANDATVMSVLFVVLGAKLLGDGISVLAS